VLHPNFKTARFFSNGVWFDKGTEAFLIEGTDYDCFIKRDGKMIPSKSGLFRGIRNGHEDEEVCGFEEFEIVEGEVGAKKASE
jgi:hypothetical protein